MPPAELTPEERAELDALANAQRQSVPSGIPMRGATPDPIASLMQPVKQWLGRTILRPPEGAGPLAKGAMELVQGAIPGTAGELAFTMANLGAGSIPTQGAKGFLQRFGAAEGLGALGAMSAGGGGEEILRSMMGAAPGAALAGAFPWRKRTTGAVRLTPEQFLKDTRQTTGAIAKAIQADEVPDAFKRAIAKDPQHAFIDPVGLKRAAGSIFEDVEARVADAPGSVSLVPFGTTARSPVIQGGVEVSEKTFPQVIALIRKARAGGNWGEARHLESQLVEALPVELANDYLSAVRQFAKAADWVDIGKIAREKIKAGGHPAEGAYLTQDAWAQAVLEYMAKEERSLAQLGPQAKVAWPHGPLGSRAQTLSPEFGPFEPHRAWVSIPGTPIHLPIPFMGKGAAEQIPIGSKPSVQTRPLRATMGPLATQEGVSLVTQPKGERP